MLVFNLATKKAVSRHMFTKFRCQEPFLDMNEMTDVISTAIISDGRIHFQDQLQKSFLLLHLGRG